MSRQGSEDGKSTLAASSDESLDERLRQASLNAHLNENLPDIPKTNFTHPSHFLKTETQEE
jgi:hypothetical protein